MYEKISLKSTPINSKCLIKTEIDRLYTVIESSFFIHEIGKNNHA